MLVLPGWLDIQLSHTHCYTLEHTMYHLIKGLELMGTVCWELQPCSLMDNPARLYVYGSHDYHNKSVISHHMPQLIVEFLNALMSFTKKMPEKNPLKYKNGRYYIPKCICGTIYSNQCSTSSRYTCFVPSSAIILYSFCDYCASQSNNTSMRYGKHRNMIYQKYVSCRPPP